MPFFAALTNGDPPQLEFNPTQSHMKHPKIVSGVLVFSFPKKAMIESAKQIAETEGYGLFKVTKRELHTGHDPKSVGDPDDFRDTLNIVGYCDDCECFTYGFWGGKCWKCKKPTR